VCTIEPDASLGSDRENFIFNQTNIRMIFSHFSQKNFLLVRDFFYYTRNAFSSSLRFQLIFCARVEQRNRRKGEIFPRLLKSASGLGCTTRVPGRADTISFALHCLVDVKTLEGSFTTRRRSNRNSTCDCRVQGSLALGSQLS
jgi:hypothetical protein